MELAIIGCGRIASIHLEAIQKLRFNLNYIIEITSLIDTSLINAELFSKKHGLSCKIFNNIDDALKNHKFDSVIICVPHMYHENIALKCFKNDINVLLEKPMAHNIKSAHKILNNSFKSKKLFMIAENSQYWPEITTVQSLLNQNKIGDIVTAKASFRQSSSNDIFDSYSLLKGDSDKKAWRYSKEKTGGGITIDGGAHWIRPLRLWFGDISKLVSLFSYPHPNMEGESLSQSILEFKNGFTAIFEGILTETTVYSSDYPFRITGKTGEIIVGYDGLGVFLFNNENPAGKRILEDNGYISSFYHQFKDFYDCIISQTTPQTTAAYSLGEMEAALAMEKSNKLNKWIYI